MVTGAPVAAARRAAADDLPDLAPPVMSWIFDAVSDVWCWSDDAFSELEGLGSWTLAGGFDGKGDVVICYDCRENSSETGGGGDEFAGRHPVMLMS